MLRVRRIVVDRKVGHFARCFFGDLVEVEPQVGRLGFVVYSKHGRWRADIVPVQDVGVPGEPCEKTPFRMMAWSERGYDEQGRDFFRWPCVRVERASGGRREE